MTSSTGSRTSSSGASLEMLQERYALQEMIGRGGMATVYRAVDTVLDRPVAVKLLYPSICSEAEFVEQFLRMERHIARLFHPNLVTIYDAGASDEGCFAVMEYVSGGSLRELLGRGTQLSPNQVVRIGAQLADALDLLHRERIIHGDVKPDNVLLDDEGNAKLVDFGIAHLATTTASISAESLGGSVPYLAPEQLEHGRADPRSDIYALGLVVYELLAARKAFDGENWVAVAAQRLARDPVPLRDIRPDIPEALNAAVMRALARKPEDRFANAREMQVALLAAASDPPLARTADPSGTLAPAPDAASSSSTHPAHGAVPSSAVAPAPDGAVQHEERVSVRTAALRAVPVPGGASAAVLSRPERSGIFTRRVEGERPWLLPTTVVVVLVDVALLVLILMLSGGAP